MDFKKIRQLAKEKEEKKQEEREDGRFFSYMGHDR